MTSFWDNVCANCIHCGKDPDQEPCINCDEDDGHPEWEGEY